MTTGIDVKNLYEALELEVRTPAEPLPVDAFLPAPEAIPSALRRTEAPRPEPAPDDVAALLGRTEAGPEPPPAARRRPRKPKVSDKSLEEEIAEFMSRGAALAPDVDPEKN
jgi:hypothetical protein